MTVVARTDKYTIYRKRNERYAIKDASKQWVRGDAKVAILLEHKLIEAPASKAPPAEVPPTEAPDQPAEAQTAGGEDASAEAAAPADD